MASIISQCSLKGYERFYKVSPALDCSGKCHCEDDPLVKHIQTGQHYMTHTLTPPESHF